MSEVSLTTALAGDAPPSGGDAPPSGVGGATPPAPAPAGIARQVIADTFRRPGARVGAAWITVLVIFGVFGPFLANSHPALLKMGGRWSSPLVQHLEPFDVILLAAATGLVLLAVLRRTTPVESVMILFAVVVVTAPLAIWKVTPKKNVVFQEYREAAAAGRVQRAVYVPVPYSANDRQRDLADAGLQPPGDTHWLGTEANGADLLSRMIHASRVALSIGIIATSISIMLGIVVGGMMGYFVGKVDIFGMRVIEVFEAIPRLFLLISFAAFVGRDLYLMMAIIGLTGWTGDARFIRAEFLRLRDLDFVHAARAAGLPLRSVLFRHILPNAIAPILVSAPFSVASAILAESTLSFLGLGLVDEPSWGQMLNQARAGGVSFYWWLAIFPGMAIFLTVLSYNLIGEALRDALDPRTLKV